MTAAALNLELAASAAIYPQKIDRDSVLLIRLSETDYRRASFLDDRVLSSQTEGHWFSYADVRSRAAAATESGPLHFIFHSGHVGSTLLSRLLDETPSILNLREPLPLRTLGDMQDQVNEESNQLLADAFRDRLQTFLRLWHRGFAETRMIVIKSTSAAGRLATTLLETRSDTKAVYLNVSLQSYLATLLAGSNSAADLSGFSGERRKRLGLMLQADSIPAGEQSAGELAAVAWLTERMTQQRAKDAFGERVLEVDFDAFLAEIEPTLLRVGRHLGILDPEGFAARAASSPVWARYSKAPEQYAYSPSLRAEILREAVREHGNEIRKGLNLIESLASRHPAVARVLG